MSSKLVLKPRMVRPHLIQRLLVPEGGVREITWKAGVADGGLSENAVSLLSGVYKLDLMISSEFKVGQEVEVVRLLAEQAQKKSPHPTECMSGSELGIFYILPRDYYLVFCQQILQPLATNEASFKLRERCGLQEWTNYNWHFMGRGMAFRGQPLHHEVVGWMDLDNGIFFGVNEAMFVSLRNFLGLKGIY